MKSWINNIIEYNNKGEKNIISCNKNELISFKINEENQNRNQTKKIKDIKINYVLEVLKDNKYFFYYCCENKILFSENIFDKIIQYNKKDISDGILFKSAVILNDKILVFKSNKIVSNGKNILFFYNYISNTIIKKNNNIENINKKNYSFIYFTNGLTIMPVNRIRKDNKNVGNNKILLCACKKYFKNQKNGILLINNENNNFNYIFYDTLNFEVYCFCPILIINFTNILNNCDNIIKDTNYFFVGGFDTNKKRGIIKLYKVNYGIKYDEYRIEYIQDIIIKENNFKGFKGPISCITQSNKDGKILISCLDGNVYLFDKPNIDYYLSYENKTEFFKNFNDCYL